MDVRLDYRTVKDDLYGGNIASSPITVLSGANNLTQTVAKDAIVIISMLREYVRPEQDTTFGSAAMGSPPMRSARARTPGSSNGAPRTWPS